MSCNCGSRVMMDFFGLLAHVALIVYTASTDLFRDGDGFNVPVLLLLIMSGITAFFHLVYCIYGLRDTGSIGPFTVGRTERNTLKWLEYSITATLGSIAIAYSGDDAPHYSIVVFIAAVAITEQVTGYTWDVAVIDYVTLSDGGDLAAGRRAYLTTFLCQIAEFMVLYEYANKTLAVWILYVIGWSAFGIWAGVRDPIFGKTMGNDPERIEAYETVYSFLSTFAKVSIFSATLVAL